VTFGSFVAAQHIASNPLSPETHNNSRLAQDLLNPSSSASDLDPSPANPVQSPAKTASDPAWSDPFKACTQSVYASPARQELGSWKAGRSTVSGADKGRYHKLKHPAKRLRFLRTFINTSTSLSSSYVVNSNFRLRQLQKDRGVIALQFGCSGILHHLNSRTGQLCFPSSTLRSVYPDLAC
jgi:hypothetical protein